VTPPKRDFLQIRGLSRDRLQELIEATLRHRALMSAAEDPEHNWDWTAAPRPLAGKIIANCFLEDSTRTRCSFEVAAQRLGATTINLTASGSSTSKGESLADTARTLAAMGVDAIVVRTAASGGAMLVADTVDCPVINAGDGRHEHPTQAILDMAVLSEWFGGIEQLVGKTVCIVGDIANSRVARSATHALTTLGADVRLVGPPTLVPPSLAHLTQRHGTVEVHHHLDAALDGADAIIMLRLQLERAAGGAVANDYRTHFGLTPHRFSNLPATTPILHPGPMNRGVEIDNTAADHATQSFVTEQVGMGVAARMAVLMNLLNPSRLSCWESLTQAVR